MKAPILGDALYSRSFPTQTLTGAISIPANRLFLHASQIEFFVSHLALCIGDT